MVFGIEPMDASVQRLAQLSVGGFRWSLLPELHGQLLNERGLRLPEWLHSGQARVVKQGPHRIVYRVELPGLCFYVKHNLIHDPWAGFRQLVRQIKARLEMSRVQAAAHRGIPTNSPLALADQETPLGSHEVILLTPTPHPC